MTICLCYSSYHFEGKGYFDPAIYIYPTSDNVPRSYLEEKEMECMAKDETIRVIIFISCHTQQPQYKFGRPVFQSWGSTISIPLFHHPALVQVLC